MYKIFINKIFYYKAFEIEFFICYNFFNEV
jgi:hypothetical protein